MYTEQHSNRISPYQPDAPRLRRTPIAHQRFLRPMQAGVVTSSMGGKLVPLTAIGLQREDGMRMSRFAVNVQMFETASMLINPVRITARAYFVPKLALDRFKDMGNIDRSYNNEPEVDGLVTPWFEQAPDGVTELETHLGLHDATRNSDIIESYNQIWNHLATHTSPSLEHAESTNGDLQPAFWSNTLKHIKPSFDDALIEGTVPIEFLNESGQLPIRGINRVGSASFTNADPTFQATESAMNLGNSPNYLQFDIGVGASEIYAELEGSNVQLTLANIKLARETAAWARLRTQFQGYSEEWMMDQLLAGVRVRDENLRQPIQLDMAEGVVGMTQRYATDSANLDKSMTDGQTTLTLEAALPPITCGGVFMIVAQALPEQLYERQRDYYNAALTVDDLPNRTADELDPQPVELVTEREIDSSSTTDDLFGYRPLNSKWLRKDVKIGGRYYRPDPAAAWDENRNRIWSPDVVDPKLGPDFYLSQDLSHDVFVNSSEDPFEWWLSGVAQVEGLTYFGPAIREGGDDYEKVQAQVPTDRLTGDGTDVPPAPAP